LRPEGRAGGWWLCNLFFNLSAKEPKQSDSLVHGDLAKVLPNLLVKEAPRFGDSRLIYRFPVGVLCALDCFSALKHLMRPDDFRMYVIEAVHNHFVLPLSIEHNAILHGA